MNFNGLVNSGNFNKISSVMKRALNGENILTVFLGGSITQGSLSSTPELCYAYRVYRWWCEKFPMAKISFFNAGIGGTTSQFGVARVEDHVLSKKPDFLLTEFAVNDEDDEFFKETYEGLIRRILNADPSPALLLMNNAWFDTGRSAERVHLEIAQYYDLPMVSMRSTVFDAISKGEFKPSDLSPDMLHPNDAGHELIAKVIINTLEMVYESVCTGTSEGMHEGVCTGTPEEVHKRVCGGICGNINECMNERANDGLAENISLMPALTKNRYENTTRIKSYNMNDYCVIFEGFKKDEREKKEFLDIFSGGFIGNKVGDSIYFVVNCKNLAIQYKKTVNRPAFIASAVIDYDEENKIILDANFDEDWGDCLYIETIAKDLVPGEHRVKITIEDIPSKTTNKEESGADISPFYLVSVIAGK